MTVQSFHWVLDNQLAGSGVPGWHGDMQADLRDLQTRGIRVILTLLEEPLNLTNPPADLHFMHFPIVDMKVPKNLKNTHHICNQVAEHLQQNRPVLVHCEAGTGRTGTLLACILIHLGRSAEAAIQEIRKKEPLYIRNSLQENFVKRYGTFFEYH